MTQQNTLNESPFSMPMMECRECSNPLGEPWHHPKSKRCYFGDGPLWRRLLRRLAP